jgi:type I restriction enzyme M protein
MSRTKSNGAGAQSTANIGFEAKLWLTADKLRNNMDAAEYKDVVLGLIFLKYISDTFEKHREKLLAGQGDYAGANADPDEYKAENVLGARRCPLIAPPGQRQTTHHRRDC